MTAASGRPAVSGPVAVAAMMGSAACWGGATVMTKGALAAFDPFVLLTVQLAASAAVLWLVVLLTSTSLPGWRSMVRAGATGMFEPGLAYAIGVPGLALTTAGKASVIAALEPVLIYLGAWILFGSRPTRGAIWAIAMAVPGVVLVSLSDPADLAGGSVLGDGMVLAGTGFAAVYVLASARLATSMPAILLTALQHAAGLGLVILLTAIALIAGWQSLPHGVSAAMLSLAVASGLIQYALAFWLYIVGLKGIPPGPAGLFLTATPVFGVLGGVVFLGEGVGPVQLPGMALILASLFLLVRIGAGPGGRREGAQAAQRFGIGRGRRARAGTDRVSNEAPPPAGLTPADRNARIRGASSGTGRTGRRRSPWMRHRPW